MPNKIKPEFVPLYPVHKSLDDAWEFINSQLPITETNELKSLLMQWHNTLLSELESKNESYSEQSS